MSVVIGYLGNDRYYWSWIYSSLPFSFKNEYRKQQNLNLDQETALEMASANNNKDAYKLASAPLGMHRRLRVVCLGAGYSGLMMAIAVREKFSAVDLELQVYEKNADLGGTWLVNR